MKPVGIKQVSNVTTRPSTIKGLNAFDSIVTMGDGYAILLRNMFAQPYGCQIRHGYRRQCTENISGIVETLASHNFNDKFPKLYAWSNGSPGEGGNATLYDVTDEGQPAIFVANYTNARWQTINFANAAGVHLIAVNGADPLLWFPMDGTLPPVQVIEGDGTGDTIKGVDPKLFTDVYSHQKRLWFVEKDSMRCWYMPPDQITGEAKSFNLGGIFTRGGYIMQIITWTIDDGDGSDDHLLFITSEGQVACYAGIDPSSANSWSLKGVYFAGAPLSNRTAVRYGGDVIMITQFGLVLMSDLLKSTKVNPNQDNIAQKVQQLISLAASEQRHRFGWQTFVYPGANMVMINIPISDTTSYQLVMNDITKAWSEFIGYNAKCWVLHDQKPYFGNMGRVDQAWSGTTDDNYFSVVDNRDITGAEIRAEVQSTFSAFDSLGIQKHYKMVRPSILSRGQFNLSLAVNVDFQFDTPLAPSSYALIKPGVWNEDLWDDAVWDGGLISYQQWQAVTGIGSFASIRMLLRSSQETYWACMDWLYEQGGVM